METSGVPSRDIDNRIPPHPAIRRSGRLDRSLDADRAGEVRLDEDSATKCSADSQLVESSLRLSVDPGAMDAGAVRASLKTGRGLGRQSRRTGSHRRAARRGVRGLSRRAPRRPRARAHGARGRAPDGRQLPGAEPHVRGRGRRASSRRRQTGRCDSAPQGGRRRGRALRDPRSADGGLRNRRRTIGARLPKPNGWLRTAAEPMPSSMRTACRST